MTEKKEEKKPTEAYSLVEVPTETGVFVRDNEKEEVLDDKRAIAEILNKLDAIQKAVA